MKIISVKTDMGNYLGILKNEQVALTDIGADEFYTQGLDALSRLEQTNRNDLRPLQQLQPAPVVPNPGKILCVGLNYQSHVYESGHQMPEQPVLFGKFNNALAADGEAIPVPAQWNQIDYEAELAVIIGRKARNVGETEALDYVLGYSCAVDFSERSLQYRTSQWLLGKTPDGFFPLGPYLVTADEIPDPQQLRIRGWYNGELRQDSHTSKMIFTVAEIIAYASRYMTLYPGDVLSTGTPEGVIKGMEDQQYMRPGDEFVVEIDKIGRLSNRLVLGE